MCLEHLMSKCSIHKWEVVGSVLDSPIYDSKIDSDYSGLK